MRKLLFILLNILIILPASLYANEGRYQNHIIGSRALSLGGAFTAISNDASAVFYNPAGITDVRRANLSITTSLYGFEFYGRDALNTAKNIMATEGFDAGDLIILPLTAGGTTGLGKPLKDGTFKHAIAFSTSVPQYSSQIIDIEEPSPDYYFYDSTTVIDRTLHTGIAYAYRPFSWLRIGAAVHYILRTLNTETTMIEHDIEFPHNFYTIGTTLRSSNHSLRANLGIKIAYEEWFRLGMSFSTPDLGIYSMGSIRMHEVGWDDEDPENKRPEAPDKSTMYTFIRDDHGSGAESQHPAQFRFGLAFIRKNLFTLTGDIIYYMSNDYSTIPSDDIRDATDFVDGIPPIPLDIYREALINYNLGIEILVTDTLSLAFGFYTNFSAAPELESDEQGFLLDEVESTLANIDMFGATATLGFFSEHSLNRVGLNICSGSGSAIMQTEHRPKVLEGEELAIYLFISSSFRYGKGKESRYNE